MSTRISEWTVGAGLLCLALMACDGSGGTPGASPRSSGAADCAIGSGDWSRSCAVERDGDLLTIRHADGGFRRFRIVKDGRGLISGDGAEQAAVTVIGQGQIEVSAGQDRYRLPASVPLS
jgi:hypothetical protein